MKKLFLALLLVVHVACLPVKVVVDPAGNVVITPIPTPVVVPVTPPPPGPVALQREILVVVTDGANRLANADVTLNDQSAPHHGTTGADGTVAFMNVVSSTQDTQIAVALEGCAAYIENITLTAGINQQVDLGGPRTTPNAVQAPPVVCMPAVPTRAQVIAVHTSFQGLTVQTQQFGAMPWFEAALAWLSPADRQAVYAAKRAAGDTHCLVFIPFGPPLYDEPGQFYTRDKFGPLDWTHGNTTIDPAVIDLIVEVRRAGFIPTVFMDGDAGQAGYAIARVQLPLLVQALATAPEGNLLCHVGIVPGFDGVFYGWTPEQITAFGIQFRALVGSGCGYLGIEHSTGHIPIGNGPADWIPGGPMETYDFLLGEFDDGRFDDSVWQVLARTIGPAYVRAPEQPAADDSGAPYGINSGNFYLRFSTPRGPMEYVVFEFWTYGWVRGASVAQVNQAIAYFKARGATLVN